MEEEKKVDPQEEQTSKPMGFFRKVGNSITKIEKYPDMAAQGLGKAISYLAKIIAILAIVLSLGMVYQTHNLIQEGVEYLKEEFPEFSYQDGILTVETEEPITISEENSVVGETIIDTKTDSQETINQYTNQITQNGGGIVVLKDQVIIKNAAVTGTISYSYKNTFEPMEITSFTKQEVIQYAQSSQIITLYVSIFLTIFIYAFIMYFLTTLSNAVLLSFFGFITTWLARIKMRYVAIFNMSVYALTLSVILNILYIAVNIFVPFSMEYFQVMYVAVAAIYLVAAILILKTDLMKQQMELMKIAEAQEIVKRQMEEKERQEKEEKEKEERKKKDRKKEEEKEKKEKKEKQEKKGKDDHLGEEPEGSNA